VYLAVKHSHLTFALVSLVLFFGRFYWHKIKGKELAKIFKVLPHVVDTFLLITAAWLCVLIAQYPIMNSWLTLKVIFVVAYIVFAFKAMKAPAKSTAIGYMTAAAISILLAAKTAIGKGLF
jgi:uncharacterized membrane protein SirB2